MPAGANKPSGRARTIPDGRIHAFHSRRISASAIDARETYDLAPDQARRAGRQGDPESAQIPGGANISIVAHLDADENPQITPFVNDVSKIDAGQARLIGAA